MNNLADWQWCPVVQLNEGCYSLWSEKAAKAWADHSVDEAIAAAQEAAAQEATEAQRQRLWEELNAPEPWPEHLWNELSRLHLPS